MRKTLLILTSLWLSSCAGAPVFEGTWATDHASQSVKRAQEKREIKCSDPVFDTLICMTPQTAWAIKRSCDAH